MTDEKLVELFWSRDEGAITEAEARYGAYLKRLAKNILGSDEDAEECLADALMSAWRAIPPARPEKLRAYLAKLTRNTAINRLETSLSARRGGGEAEAVIDELAECLPSGMSVEGEVDAKELERAVEGFVRGLPKREGDIFVRRCFFTESAASIAKRYGMTAHAVTVTLARTREKLRKHLKKEGFIDG